MQDARGIVFDGTGRAGGGGSYVLDSNKGVDTFIEELRLKRKRDDEESKLDTAKVAAPDVYRSAAPWDQVELQKDLETRWYEAAKPIVLNKFKTPEEKAAALMNLELVRADVLRKSVRSGKLWDAKAQKMVAMYNEDPDLFPDNSGEYITEWMSKPIDEREPFALQPLQDNDWIKDIQAQKIEFATDDRSWKNPDGTIHYKGGNIWDENKVKSAYANWVMQGNKQYRSFYKNAKGLAQQANPTATPDQIEQIAAKQMYEYFKSVKQNQFGQKTREGDRSQSSLNFGGGGNSIKVGKYLWTKGSYVDTNGGTTETFTLSDPSGAQSELPKGNWIIDDNGKAKEGMLQGVERRNGQLFVVIRPYVHFTGSVIDDAGKKTNPITIPIDVFKNYNREKIQGEYIMGMSIEDLINKFEQGNTTAVNSPTTAPKAGSAPKKKKPKPY